VVLTHLVGGTRSEDEASYLDGVRKHYSGPVAVARDLMEF
jgi:ribonuclease BN (tRNA processing enzyme)